MLSSDIVKKVSITGSTRVGKIILKKAAKKYKELPELSGHSPFIVFEDADLEKVTDIAIFAKFRNTSSLYSQADFIYIQVKE